MNLRAIIREFGHASQVVKLEQHDLDPLNDGNVRVRMQVRSVNPSDLITISGAYRSRTQLPFLPGFEGVGTIEDVGYGPKDLKIGDRVIPIQTAGAWQEIRDSESTWCLKVHDGLTDEQAAMSYVNPMTAWVMMQEIAKLKDNMNIAITAAGSTIGQILVHLANLRGEKPLAFVRSDQAVANLKGMSAQILKYENDDEFRDVIRHVSRDPVDVVFDCVGGTTSILLANALRTNGQFIHYGLLSGKPISPSFFNDRPDVDFKMFHLRSWIREVELAKVHHTYSQVSDLILTGMPGFGVRARYPLKNIKEAMIDAENLTSNGKVLITN